MYVSAVELYGLENRKLLGTNFVTSLFFSFPGLIASLRLYYMYNVSAVELYGLKNRTVVFFLFRIAT